MHRYSRMHLSPDAAIRSLDSIDLEEKSRVAEGIALLAVIDQRRDYMAAGYSCMRNYCMERLHWSEDRTMRRLQVARAAQRYPELFEYLADGRLSVATAATVVPQLTPDSARNLLSAAAFKSRNEILRLLATTTRATPNVLETAANVQETSGSPAPGQVKSLPDPAMATTCTDSPAPAPALPARRGRISSSATGGYDVRLSITLAEHDDLREAQALLGHAIPCGDPAEIYARAIRHYIAHLKKQRLGVKPAAAAPAHGRGIPKPLRRLVWERDGGRCAFVGSDGHRCGETHRLEFDHVTPLALGGATTAENLRLLCRAHNQHAAERALGPDHVHRRRELAQRERAHARAAARAEASRQHERARASAPAPNIAIDSREADLRAALRGLGFSAQESNRGAVLGCQLQEATLEACLRHALHELTRPLVARGERMARSTA